GDDLGIAPVSNRLEFGYSRGSIGVPNQSLPTSGKSRASPQHGRILSESSAVSVGEALPARPVVVRSVYGRASGLPARCRDVVRTSLALTAGESDPQRRSEERRVGKERR